MADEHDVALRSARDRIIDLAGIGDTYPLTDLNVVADQLKVNFGDPAAIPIENAQAGVTYELRDPKGSELRDKEGNLIGASHRGEGKDETLTLNTPRVDADITYRIRATKRGQTPRLLDERAPVKVGLDVTLGVQILPRDPQRAPQPSDPTILRYGEAAVVRVMKKTQEGVIYSLVINGADVGVADRGNLGDIDLVTPALREDSTIEVRATKKFAASENRADEVNLLTTRRYLKVMPNPALGVSVDPIVDYGKGATVRVDKSQDNVQYQAYLRLIPDRDFVRGATTVRVVKVPVPGKGDVQVRSPELVDVGPGPEGYNPVGLATEPLTEDAIFIVQATKDHRVGPGEAGVRTSVWLAQAALALVRPDPARALALQLPAAVAQTGNRLQVSGGQPGVYYYFRLASSGKDLDRPAYFHKRSADDALNKGVDQLAIEVDFAVAADPERPGADRPSTAPRPPLLDVPALAGGDSFAVRAMKAQTGVEVPMALGAQIPKPPALQADPAIVDYGATAKISASAPVEGFQFTLNGAPVTLPAETAALAADTVFALGAAEAAPKGMQVELVQRASVLVRPNAKLAVSAKDDTVDKDETTDIVVAASQPGVNYQLMAGSTPVGDARAGTGADLALRSGAISADTTFSVTAIRADNAQLDAVLEQRATVKVAAAAPAPAPQ